MLGIDFGLGASPHQPARVHEVPERDQREDDQGEELDDADQPLVGLVLVTEVGALVVLDANLRHGQNPPPVHVGPEICDEDADTHAGGPGLGVAPAHQPGVAEVKDVTSDEQAEAPVDDPGVLVLQESQVDHDREDQDGDAPEEGPQRRLNIPFGVAVRHVKLRKWYRTR